MLSLTKLVNEKIEIAKRATYININSYERKHFCSIFDWRNDLYKKAEALADSYMELVLRALRRKGNLFSF